MAIFVDKGHYRAIKLGGCVYKAGAFITQNTVGFHPIVTYKAICMYGDTISL